MSFDDNYFLSTPAMDDAPMDTFFDPDDPQDPEPNVVQVMPYGVESIIQDNATWLQARPRTAVEIISALLPTSINRISDFAEMATFVGGYLFDAGYAPQFDNPCNPTWYWLEGASV